eukprot:m.154942 g.154942  ORF g.154942 m.154942 type:complete len:197 (+) comp10198_c0_seq5:671-1261(+)
MTRWLFRVIASLWLPSTAHCQALALPHIFYAYPFTYRTQDGRFMAVGAIEPHFFQLLLDGLGLDATNLPDQSDKERWGELRAAFEDAFARKTQAEWCIVFAESDACVTPVLDTEDMLQNPYVNERGFIAWNEAACRREPRPAPLLQRTPATPPGQETPLNVGQHSREILSELGLDESEILRLIEHGVVMESRKAKL